MGEWKEYKLKSAPLKIIDGDRGNNYPSQKEFSDIGYCLFLSTRNVRKTGFNFSDKQFITAEKDSLLRKGKLIKNDIILTTRGTIGNLAFVDKNIPYKNIRINSGMVIIRPEENVLEPIYCFYLFRALQKDFETFTSGSAQPQLPIKDLSEMDISLPELSEQQSISSVLCSLDDKIDLLHRQNNTLEQIAETLFRQWFVEEADESWEQKTLEELIYFNPTEKINRANEYTFYDMKGLSDNSMCIDEGIKRQVSSASSFRNGDTLLAKITPCLENGKTGFVMHLQENEIARGSTEFIVMRSKGRVNAYYIYCLSRSSEFRDSAILSMTGTSGRQRVQIDLLKNYSIYYNEIKIEEFGKIVKQYFEKIKINQIQIRTLTQLRDTLLPKLMSGEVRVKN